MQKRKAPSFQKVEILQVVNRNPSRKRTAIARDLGIAPSTLNCVVAKRKNTQTQASAFNLASEQTQAERYAKLELALLA